MDENQQMDENNQGADLQDYRELQKNVLLEEYKDACKTEGIQPHRAFVMYLEDTVDENDNLEIVIQGNNKLNFSNRLDDK